MIILIPFYSRFLRDLRFLLLVKKGLVEKGEKDRRTNVYMVTKRGTREIEARRNWENEYIEL
ncbi:PadR family transcriptional regulator (plasmid) [Natrarchaeobaculum sulfurireducens]|uniref:PadR family transcriptional regulator n=1 Tax=Natrarchaeobaculum sulfurireducens TaxID=2044521 RepID=A0A346P9H4_9EURY|nr:PadR family transcriptional regulator [Natrarchaeobaculum sulfurireducens]